MSFHVAIALVLFSPLSALAAQAIVLTTPRMVTGDFVGVNLEAVEVPGGRSQSLGRLPGTSLNARVFLNGVLGDAVISTGPSADELISRTRWDRSFVTRLSTKTFEQEPLVVSGHDTLLYATSLNGRREMAVVAPTLRRVEIRSLETGATVFTGELPAEPVDAVFVEGGTQLVVLCRNRERGEATLYSFAIRDAKPAPVQVPLAGASGRFGAEPVALANSPSRRIVYALVSGYALDESGEAATWLHAFDLDTFEEISQPIRVLGLAAHGGLKPGGDGICWIATQRPGTDFGTVTGVHMNDEGLQIVAEYPQFALTQPLRIAARPSSTAVAIGANMNVSVRPSYHAQPTDYPFPAAVTALAWNGGGLWIGEASRVHHIGSGIFEADSPFEDSAVAIGLRRRHCSLIHAGQYCRDFAAARN